MANLHSLNTTEVEFKATSSPYRIAFRVDMKYYTVLYEQQWHRTRTSCSHPSNNVPQRLAERVWWTKSQSWLLNIYFRFSPCSYRFTSATVRIHVHTAPKYGTEPLRYVTLKFRGRLSAASLFNKNPAEITVPMYEQKPYPVWFLWRRKSNLV